MRVTHLTSVARNTRKTRSIQAIVTSRMRQSPLWATARNEDKLTIIMSGQVSVRKASIFGAVHAWYTVGRKVSGPKRMSDKKISPDRECTNDTVSLATRLLIESTKSGIDTSLPP